MNATAIEIVAAGATDAAVLAELGARTFLDTFGTEFRAEDIEPYVATAFSPERMALELADPGSSFLLARADGVAVGYAKLRSGPAPAGVYGPAPLELERIYVDRPWLGKRVGARLMDAVLDEARRRGARIVWLGVWGENRRAAAFYEKYGFAVVGSKDFRMGSDVQTDLVMALSLVS